MNLTYNEIIDIMDANAGYLSMDTPENLYNFLNNIPIDDRGSITEFCYNDLKYQLLDKLEKIPGGIFWGCDLSFNTWTVGSHVIQIDTYAFAECKLDTVDLSNAKITELSDGIFYNTYIKKIILPEGLKKIGEETFQNSSIEEIYIPSTVEFIGKDSFEYCRGLKKVHLCKDSIAQNKLKIDQDDLNRIKTKIVLY